MAEIEILLDAPDRRFRLGEYVAGRVVVEAGSNLSISEVYVSYRWRTHGRGDRDQGREEKLILSVEKTRMGAGERRRFAFRFRAPDGPISYHGQLVNVDWYLTARAQTGALTFYKTEQDFLLVPGHTAGSISLGTREVATAALAGASLQFPLAGASQESQAARARRGSCVSTVFGWVFLTVFAGIWLSLMLDPLIRDHGPVVLIVVGVLGALIALGWFLYRNAYKRKLEILELSVAPTVARGGTELACRLDLRVKNEVELKLVKAGIYGRESASYTAGTSKATETRQVSANVVDRPYGEVLTVGRSVSFRCTLPTPADAATFESANNKVEWIARVEVQLRRWPGVSKEIPITVVPLERSSAASDPWERRGA